MLNFIQTYWQYISAGLLLIIEVVIIFVKKRPQIVDNSFISQLCAWIEEAEKTYKVGSDKMVYVLEKAKSYLGSSYKESDVRYFVEWILTLPQKKEK